MDILDGTCRSTEKRAWGGVGVGKQTKKPGGVGINSKVPTEE